MCGIAAIVGEVTEDTIEAMLRRMAHRGPDGVGVHTTGSGKEQKDRVLGHCRLAIIDPQGGRQPIVDSQNGDSRALVANGMIYNYRQLRETLGDVDFSSGSDSESIFHTCLKNGSRGVGELDGMFAFVLLDEGRVIAARDPIGIKPLYVGRKGPSLHFASEIKALADVADDIREFPPGHVYDSQQDAGGEAFLRYYQVPAPLATPREDSGWVTKLRNTLEQAVAKRLQSDVPLGCFLSGGLDSSIIAALARRHKDELHTFAVGIEGSNDLQAARCVAEHLDTIHHEYTITAEEVRRELPHILYHLETYDQDLVRSAVPCWFVSRVASDFVKVVLTGEGADELFAGYRYHKDYRDHASLGNELRRSISAMHNVNLQRVDRMTMAHGLEARVPFLDRTMIDLSMDIPSSVKLQKQRGRPVEKWILRQACSDLLPRDIVWRIKEQFDEGSGLSSLLGEIVPEQPGPKRLVDGREARGSEEAWYASILADGFSDPEPVFKLAARWSDGRVD